MRTALARLEDLTQPVPKRPGLLDLRRAEDARGRRSSAWHIVEVARMTSITIPVGAAPPSSV